MQFSKFETSRTLAVYNVGGNLYYTYMFHTAKADRVF